MTSGCHSRCPLCSCPTWPASLLVAPLIAGLGWACHQLSALAQLPHQAVGVSWPPERGQQGMLPQGRGLQRGPSCCLCEWPSAFPSSPLPKAAVNISFVKGRSDCVMTLHCLSMRLRGMHQHMGADSMCADESSTTHVRLMEVKSGQGDSTGKQPRHHKAC